MKKLIRCLALLTMVAMLAGCAPVDPSSSSSTTATDPATTTTTDPAASSTSADKEKVVVGAITSPWTNLYPYEISGTYDEILNIMIYDRLMDVSMDGELVPREVTEVKVSEDGKTLTLSLNQEAHWHDGEPVTADDVVWSFQISCNPELSVSRRYLMNILEGTDENGAQLSEGSVGVSKVDDYTIQLVLKTPMDPVTVFNTLKQFADLDILVEMTAQDQSALVEVAGGHTNVVRSEKNGVAITLQTAARPKGEAAHGRETALDLHGIFDYAATVDVGEVQDLLDRQIQYNSAIAREGIANCYGCGIGACLIKNRGDDVRTRAKALAAAGSDARMGGCPMPVIINSGSGNQGLTVCLPVVVYAQELGADDERLYRALILANLVAIQLKSGIGCLSAFCGAVSAACGAGAAITWLRGGNFEEISSAISNALATSAGIVCDGAKPSCAAKIAVAVDTALLASDLALQGRDFQAGDGLVGADIEETAMNMMRLGRVGMRKTDKEILHMMLRH